MKKIALNKDTLRKLDDSELRYAQGGDVPICQAGTVTGADCIGPTDMTCKGKTCVMCQLPKPR